jgi:hypothetical protein
MATRSYREFYGWAGCPDPFGGDYLAFLPPTCLPELLMPQCCSGRSGQPTIWQYLPMWAWLSSNPSWFRTSRPMPMSQPSRQHLVSGLSVGTTCRCHRRSYATPRGCHWIVESRSGSTGRSPHGTARIGEGPEGHALPPLAFWRPLPPKPLLGGRRVSPSACLVRTMLGRHQIEPQHIGQFLRFAGFGPRSFPPPILRASHQHRRRQRRRPAQVY